MRHFVAYHNVSKMGPLNLVDGRLRLLTNKSVAPLVDQTVWFVVGDVSDKRRFVLGGVLRVEETGVATEPNFRNYATGPGRMFDPPIALKDLPWFPLLMNRVGNFGLGVQEVTDETVISGLNSVVPPALASVDMSKCEETQIKISPVAESES